MIDENCVFCKIATHEIPTNKVYEDEHVIAFDDMEPLMPVHTLIIPKQHYKNVGDDVLGHTMAAVKKVAEIKGLTDRGYRCLINTGDDASQSVKHFHVHVLGGGHMPRPNDQDWGEAATNADKINAEKKLRTVAIDYAKAIAAEKAEK